jgi:hypothetical protein
MLAAMHRTSQPVLGLAGLTFVVPVFLVLAFGPGLGPLCTFALPVVAMIAFWWQDWPGSALRPGWAGLTDTLLIVVAAIVFSLVGKVLPAVCAFTVMLQLTLVTEGWPIHRLPRVPAGIVALVVSWALGVAIYPWVEGSWLAAVGVWQMVFFVTLRGWPFSAIARRGYRLPVANLVVLGCGWATVMILPPDQTTAICGCAIAVVLVTGMLFEGWLPGRALQAGTVVVLTGLLYCALAAVHAKLDEEWIANAALNGIGLAVILHVAIWRRWPVVTGSDRGAET